MSKQTFNVTVLDSGLTVVTDYLPEAKTASAFWNLNAGGDRDLPGKEGTAHFFEHLLGAGHKYDPEFDTIKTLAEWGGGWDLYTGPQYTAFAVDCLARRAPEFITMAGNAVCHSLLTKERIEIERQIIRREFFEGQQDFGKKFWRDTFEGIYGGKGFSKQVIGNLDNIMRISRDDLLEYRENFYLSEDMVFGMSGPVPHEHVLKLAEIAFKDVKRGKNPILEAPEFIHSPQKRLESPVEQQQIAIAIPLPSAPADPFNKNVDAIVAMLATPLGIHMRDAGFTYSSTAIYANRYRGGSHLRIAYETEPALAEKSLQSLKGFIGQAYPLLTERGREGLLERKEFADGVNWYMPGARTSAIHARIKLREEVRSFEDIKSEEILPELGALQADFARIWQQPASVFTSGPCREVGELDIKGGANLKPPEPETP